MAGLAGAADGLRWEPDRQDSGLALAAFVLFPVAVGTAIGFMTSRDVQTWYQTIRKPAWQPPSWLFGPVWTVLYMLVGFAAWAVWTHGGFSRQSDALLLFGVNLLLNFAWTPTFFMLKRMDWALVDITALLATLVPLILVFNRVEPLAAAALLPYLAWASFAAVLNYTLLKLNSQPELSNSTKEPGVDAVHPEVESSKKAA